MGEAVDKLDLNGGLAELGAQVSRVKGQKTMKLNLLSKALKRFEVNLSNSVVWQDVIACKLKSDDCCEAYGMLLDAICAALDKELVSAADEQVEAFQTRRDTVANELHVFEQDKEQLDDKYFDLATGVQERKGGDIDGRAGPAADSRGGRDRVKPVDSLKPPCVSLKLTPSEFQVWAAKARGWVQQSNFTCAEINVQHLFLTSILDKDTQQKVEAMEQYNEADAYEVLRLVEEVHNAANPLFVKRANFFAAYREASESSSAYIARVKVLGDLAKLSEMDQSELVKFKVLKDLPIRIREKVLLLPDTTLEALTKLVAEHEAMEVINANLKADPAKLPKLKVKEQAMPAAEKEKKKKKLQNQKRSCQMRHIKSDAGAVRESILDLSVQQTSQRCCAARAGGRRAMLPPSA